MLYVLVLIVFQHILQASWDSNYSNQEHQLQAITI
jgi:hypothetical protein